MQVLDVSRIVIFYTIDESIYEMERISNILYVLRQTKKEVIK